MNCRKWMAVAVCCFALLVAFSAAGVTVEAAGAPRFVGGGDSNAAQRRRTRRVKRRTTVHTKTGRVTEGAWGGSHLRMNVNSDGASLDFDCANGQIAAPFETDSEGRFDLPGTYTREGPGPIRIGREPTARPARFAGRVEGEQMTLSVTLEGSEKPLSEYTLTRGNEGRIVKCR
ncbi:MAG: hypothetical protein ACJ74T_20660 [Pyrinomonadaceae bacterium]